MDWRQHRSAGPVSAVAALAGVIAFVGAGAALAMARLHMAAEGVICGQAVAHCGWCYLAPALAAAGFAGLAFALQGRSLSVAPASVARAGASRRATRSR